MLAAPVVGSRDVSRVPQHLLGEAHRDRAVGHAVAEPPDEGDAALLEGVEQVDSPKRTRAIEPLRHHAGADAPQGVTRDRARHRDRAHVVADVELWDRRPTPRGPSAACAAAAARFRSLRRCERGAPQRRACARSGAGRGSQPPGCGPRRCRTRAGGWRDPRRLAARAPQAVPRAQPRLDGSALARTVVGGSAVAARRDGRPVTPPVGEPLLHGARRRTLE